MTGNPNKKVCLPYGGVVGFRDTNTGKLAGYGVSVPCQSPLRQTSPFSSSRVHQRVQLPSLCSSTCLQHAIVCAAQTSVCLSIALSVG